MNVEKELFDIFATKKNQWECYVAVQELLKHYEYYVKGQQNAEFHKVLTKLHDSIENGGNEEKLASMTYINRLKSDISSVYPEFV